jgi:aquaporin Z
VLGKLKNNWPEYLIEGWALGMFMVSAGFATILLEHPGSPLRAAIGSADLRRVIVGLCMGMTAIALIYSPWGRRSGAHMNPAVTLSFLRLRRIAPADAAFFVLAQFAGGTLGVLAVKAFAGSAFTEPPVSWVATMPTPPFGLASAFAAEAVIAFGMMLMILLVSGSRLTAYTGVFAGVLVATYIAVEAPVSGMSMNPARSFASAAPAGLWRDLWIYFLAPPLGMLAAAELHSRLRSVRGCAKLMHPSDVRCIHCHYEPPGASTPQALAGEITHG